MSERKVIHEPSVSQTMQAVLELGAEGKWKVLSVNATARRVVLEAVEEEKKEEEKPAAKKRAPRKAKTEE